MAKAVHSKRARAQDIDRQVAARIRQHRIISGLSQHRMAGRIGVSYQQVRNYETGINRISAGRLYEIARALHVKVENLYGVSQAAEAETNAGDQMMRELTRNFAAISDPRIREAVVALVRSMAEDGVGDGSKSRRRAVAAPDWTLEPAHRRPTRLDPE